VIKIKLLGPFSKLTPEVDKDGYWNVEEKNQTVEELLMATKIKDVKMNYSVIVNNTNQTKEYLPHDGDILSIVPLFFAG